MSFLAPLFLTGIALVAGPILFHLIRQIPRNRIVFSSHDLLEASEPKTEKSRRIQNPLLLIIRCLIVALLAAAFARPFMKSENTSGDALQIRKDIVVAIDISASMSRTNLSDLLAERVETILSEIGASDQVSAFAFTDTTESLITHEQWRNLGYEQARALLFQKLVNLQATNLPGYLDLALAESVSILENLRENSSSASFAEIFLVSDFAEGTRLQGIERIEWPADLNVRRVDIDPQSANATNLGLRWIGWGESEESEKEARIGITSTAPNEVVPAQLSYYRRNGEQLGESKQLLLENMTEHVVSIPFPDGVPSDGVRFRITGDENDFDNELSVVPPFVPKFDVRIFSDSDFSDAKGAPYFISRGLMGFDTPRATLTGDRDTDSENDAYIIDRPLNVPELKMVGDELQNGKTVLALASSTQFLDTLQQLANQPQMSLSYPPPGHLLVGDVDFSHFLFQPFSDPRFSNFASIRTWKGLILELPSETTANVVASFDNGSPLLTEFKIGKGTLFVWASGWSPSDSQWPLSTKFVPLLHRFSLLATGGIQLSENSILNSSNLDRYNSILSDSESVEIGFNPTSEAGRFVAFQQDPIESKTSKLSDDDWDQLGLPELNEAAQATRIDRIANSLQDESSAQIEKRQGIWKWLLWSVLGLLIFESLLAVNQRQKVETQTV